MALQWLTQQLELFQMLLSCRRKRINTLGVSDGQRGKAEMFAQPQCSGSWTAFQRHFFSLSPDVPEEDANEPIFMLQNCQILSKKPNRMSSSPLNLLSDGECLYCYESYISGGFITKYMLFSYFRTDFFIYYHAYHIKLLHFLINASS